MKQNIEFQSMRMAENFFNKLSELKANQENQNLPIGALLPTQMQGVFGIVEALN